MYYDLYLIDVKDLEKLIFVFIFGCSLYYGLLEKDKCEEVIVKKLKKLKYKDRLKRLRLRLLRRRRR